MGSRSHIVQKLRQSPQFCAMERWLDDNKLPFSAHPPTGKGHPYLLIDTAAGQIKHVIACTPRGSGSVGAALARLRRAIDSKGGPP